jgi:hypothetical protein
MGLKVLEVEGGNPVHQETAAKVEFLIDSGAFTLEALGLSLDPLRRELKPLPMILLW